MFSKLADYLVLELILGDRIVNFLALNAPILMYFVVALYFANATYRHYQLHKLRTQTQPLKSSAGKAT